LNVRHVRGLEEDEDGHEITGMQLPMAQAAALARRHDLATPNRLRLHPELIDRADEAEYTWAREGESGAWEREGEREHSSPN
jgi:hypothetical protein